MALGESLGYHRSRGICDQVVQQTRALTPGIRPPMAPAASPGRPRGCLPGENGSEIYQPTGTPCLLYQAVCCDNLGWYNKQGGAPIDGGSPSRRPC